MQPAEPCNIFNLPNRLGLNSKQGRERENDDTGKGCSFFIPHVVLFLKSFAINYITFGDTYKIFITYIGLDDNNITSDLRESIDVVPILKLYFQVLSQLYV